MKPWPNPVYAVDSSFDRLTPEEVQRLKGAGVELFIQALWTGTQQPIHRVENLDVASNGGLAIAGYSSLTSSFSGEWHMVQGRTGIPTDLWEGMVFVAPDVELPNIRVGEILAAARWVKERHTGLVPIYTNYNSWTTKVTPANSLLLSSHGFPLWNAFWDDKKDVDYPSLRFGGWEDDWVVGEQWSGGTYVGGQFVDRNTFRREFVFPKEEEDHMPTQEYEELKSRLDGLQELVAIALPILAADTADLVDGTTEVPIWPVGLVELREIRHRAYYSKQEDA